MVIKGFANEGTEGVHGISQNQNSLGWKGPFKAILSNLPAMSRDIFK